MRVALATADYLPHGSEDDQVLMHVLRAAGIEPVAVIWDQPADWQKYDAVIVRSIWDYHLKYARFLEWLAELDACGVTVHNPTHVLRWNADKRYMLELEELGVRITPSRLAARHDAASLAGIAAQTGWRHLVIKPTVASTGYQTWMAEAPITAATEQQFSEQNARMDLLVQEFARGVHAGELSLVFLRGRYSHAVLKRAAGSEFRVHAEHGGTVEPCQATRAQIAWGESVLQAAGQPWTYARVDAVEAEQGLMLMELELLDPELFFKYHPAAANDMIHALAAQARAR